MLLTVSGPPGAGKSTSVQALAEAFELQHISGGDIFRELAADAGMSTVEFNQHAETDDNIDRELDERLREIAITGDDILLESRLAGWLAGEEADIKLWLDAPLEVRAQRIAAREDKSLEIARAETEARETSESQRYKEYYNIDIGDQSIYDIVLNTARWSETEVPNILIAAIHGYTVDDDE
ncbi:MAG: cytidylate kinase, putative, partial [Haloquadratum sp. J07HQX50]